MTEADATTGFQIEGADIEAETTGKKIQARGRARREEALSMGLDHEAYAKGLYPLPGDAVFSRDLYEAVGQASISADMVGTELELTETRMPLVGGLAHRFRAAAHELVLFYLNQSEARQIRFNKQTTRALAIMVQDLEAEVRDLRARLAELEDSQE